jgi:hypothetical protein
VIEWLASWAAELLGGRLRWWTLIAVGVLAALVVGLVQRW